MNRNIAKQFTATLSLLDVASNKTHKYKCFHGEDIQLTVNVVGEEKRRIDLSNTNVKIYFILDKNVNEPVYRQDTGIVVNNLGVITVMLEKSYIRIGNNVLKIVLYDEDQTVFLQPLIISCIDPLIGEAPDLEIPDDINVRDEIYDIRRIIGDLQDFDDDLGSEIIEARNEYGTVGERLDNFDSQLDTINQNRVVDSENFKVNSVNMIAHRGLSSEAPENTIPAYELASKNGYWGVECDILETKDNEFILMHDNTVDRTTNGEGLVSELTLAQIKSLNIDFGNGISNYENLKVPTLEEFLQCVKNNGVVPIIEIKSMTTSSIEKFIEIIKRNGFEHSCIIICFDKNCLIKIRELNKNIRLSPLLDFTVENIEFCSLLKNADIDVPYSQVTIELVKEAHYRNIKVNCWTVNNDNEKNSLIEKGVDFITTDLLRNNKDKTMHILNSINLINDKIDDVIVSYNYKYITENFKIGGHTCEVGKHFSECFPSSNSYRTNRAFGLDKLYIKEKIINIKYNTEHKFTLLPFDEKGYFLKDIGWLTNTVVKLPDKTFFVIPYFASKDDTSFTSAILNTLTNEIKMGLDDEKIYFSNIKLGGLKGQVNDSFNQRFSMSLRNDRAIDFSQITINERYNIETFIDEKFDITMVPFDSDDNCVADLGWIINSSITLPSNASYVIPYFSKKDSSNFTNDDIKLIKQGYVRIYS